MPQQWGGWQQPGGESRDTGMNAMGNWVDSPRTAAWRQALAKGSDNPKKDVDDWLSERNKALAAGPAHKAKSGAALSASQPQEEDMPLEEPTADFQELARVFEDERPWADITDADEDHTESELLRIQQDLESKSREAEEVHEMESSVTNERGPAVEPPPTEDACASNPLTEAAVHSEELVASPVEPALPPAPENQVSHASADSAPTADLPVDLPTTSASPELESAAPALDDQTTSVTPSLAPQEPAEPAEPAPTPAVLTEPAHEQTSSLATATEKRKKALQKKLRQIRDLEEKQKSGVKLDDDQAAKVASKEMLELELENL